MNTHLETLEAQALQLTPSDRSHLLATLLASLDTDPEVEQAWAQEADRRENALETGSSALIPGHEALARLRAKLAQ